MSRKWLFILIALLLVALPAQAQEGDDWTVYLFNASQVQLISVNSDGTTGEIDLGLPPNVYPSQAEYPLSPDNSRAAFCVVQNSADGITSAASVHILNLASNSTERVVELGQAMGCSVGRFSDDGSQIGVGVVYDFPFTENPNIAHLWEALVIDVASGEIANRLTPDAPIFATIDGSERWAYLPIIQQFRDGQVTFSLTPYGTDNTNGLPAFRWQPASGNILPIQGWGNWNSDALPNGELLWTEEDPALPAGETDGPMPRYNTVRVATNDGEPQTVFYSGDWLPYQARFVNGGQQLLISLVSPFNIDAPETSQAARLVLLNRDGTQTEVGAYPSFVDTAPTSDGFVVLWAENTDGTAPPQIYLDHHTGGNVTRLWEITSDNFGVSWSIVWSTAAPTGEGLPPFMTVE